MTLHLCLVKNKQGSDEDHMDRLLRDTKGRSKNKKQARVSFDPQSLHNTHTASQSHQHYQQQIGPA